MNKIKNNEGSTILIAILGIFIVLSSIMAISMYLNNQLRTTKKTKDSIQSSYLAQAGIETSLGEICRDIETYLNELDKNIKNSKINYKSTNEISINIELSNAKKYFNSVYEDLKNTEYSDDIYKILNDINLIKGYTSLEEYNESILKIIDSTLKFSSDIDNDTRELIKENLCKGLLSLNKEITSSYIYNCEVQNHEKVQFEKTYGYDQGWSVNVAKIFDKEVDIRSAKAQEWHTKTYSINTIATALQAPGGNNIQASKDGSYLNDLANNLNSLLTSTGIHAALESLRATLGKEIFNDDEDPENPINKAINKTIDAIDDTIECIQNIEYTLYKMYMEHDNLIDKEKLLMVIKNLENIEHDIIEIRCKLGGNNNTSLPDNEEENLTKIIKNPYYTVTFENNNSNLNVSENKTLSSDINLIVKTNSNGVIQANLQDTYIYIKSEGYNHNSKYKINCKVQFFIEKVGNVFKSRYSIVSNEFN